MLRARRVALKCGHANGDGFCRAIPDRGPSAFFCRQKGLIREQLFSAVEPDPRDAQVKADSDYLVAALSEREALEAYDSANAEFGQALRKLRAAQTIVENDLGEWGVAGGGWRQGREARKAARQIPSLESEAKRLERRRDRAAEDLQLARVEAGRALEWARVRAGFARNPAASQADPDARSYQIVG